MSIGRILINASTSDTQDVVIHHAANAAAVAIPTGAAYAFGVRDLFVYVPAALGAIYYLILIAEKVARWVSYFRGTPDVSPPTDR